MEAWIARVPRVDWALILALLIAAATALPTARRGGRYRALPGWVGVWTAFAGLLICLTHAPRWVSYPLLALLMFATLRGYFYVVPLRPRDRYAVLASYLAIPLVLWPAFIHATDTFQATVPVALFLFLPVFLVLGRPEKGLLDSMGRTLLGVVFFVFCTAHLALLTHVTPEALPGRVPTGLPEMFGVLVLAAELPRRLAGDFAYDSRWWKPISGVLISLPLVIGLGLWLGPLCGMVDDDGARAGVLVLVAVTVGALVSTAVNADLELRPSATRIGRAALLARLVPAVYAAPVFFYYLHHFA